VQAAAATNQRTERGPKSEVEEGKTIPPILPALA
jgi:hypothetical protein